MTDRDYAIKSMKEITFQMASHAQDYLEVTIERHYTDIKELYIPFQVNHLHGQTEPVPRRVRATLTETEPMLFYANYQATAC